MAIEWIFAVLLVSSLAYIGLALATWPYARPLVPLWLLLLCIVFPLFFPFLLLFLLFQPVPPEAVVVVVERPEAHRRVLARSNRV